MCLKRQSRRRIDEERDEHDHVHPCKEDSVRSPERSLDRRHVCRRCSRLWMRVRMQDRLHGGRTHKRRRARGGANCWGAGPIQSCAGLFMLRDASWQTEFARSSATCTALSTSPRHPCDFSVGMATKQPLVPIEIQEGVTLSKISVQNVDLIRQAGGRVMIGDLRRPLALVPSMDRSHPSFTDEAHTFNMTSFDPHCP